LLLGAARRQCHSAVHRFYPNRVLAEEYYTLELLLSRYVKSPTVSTFSLFTFHRRSDKVRAFAKWASTLQGRGNLRMK